MSDPIDRILDAVEAGESIIKNREILRLDYVPDTIQYRDSDGARYDIKIEGNVTRDKVLKIFEMMDLMNIEEEQETTNMDSVGSKIWHGSVLITKIWLGVAYAVNVNKQSS